MGRWLKVCATNLGVSCSNSILNSLVRSRGAAWGGGWGGGIDVGIYFEGEETDWTEQRFIIVLPKFVSLLINRIFVTYFRQFVFVLKTAFIFQI